MTAHGLGMDGHVIGHGLVWFGWAWLKMAENGSKLLPIAWAWLGIWLGMIWYGLVWFGMVGHG